MEYRRDNSMSYSLIDCGQRSVALVVRSLHCAVFIGDICRSTRKQGQLMTASAYQTTGDRWVPCEVDLTQLSAAEVASSMSHLRDVFGGCGSTEHRLVT